MATVHGTNGGTNASVKDKRSNGWMPCGHYTLLQKTLRNLATIMDEIPRPLIKLNNQSTDVSEIRNRSTNALSTSQRVLEDSRID
ncbi:hypothetical protein TNCV_278301 [Trichonephila clavipes]|nr:hypothetical protein TNCV_278301 [Trichonephila clavipes]